MQHNQDNLILRAREGDIVAFEQLVKPYQAGLLRYLSAQLACRDDAEDALQEALLQVFRGLKSYRRQAAFSTWLYRVVINTARNWLRSESRASSNRIAQKMVSVGIESPKPFDEVLFEHERQSLVKQTVMQLPQHYRNTLVLRHYAEMSYEEIAAVLDIPLGTVRSRISKARQLLVEKLKGTGYFE